MFILTLSVSNTTAIAPDDNLYKDQNYYCNYNYFTSFGSRDFHCVFYNGKFDSFNHMGALSHIVNSRCGLPNVTKAPELPIKRLKIR